MMKPTFWHQVLVLLYFTFYILYIYSFTYVENNKNLENESGTKSWGILKPLMKLHICFAHLTKIRILCISLKLGSQMV